MVLNAAEVIDAGAALARESGVDEVGMRAVATQLGVTPMALYRHVPDAEALRRLVIELLLRDLPIAAPGEVGMQAVREWALRTRRVLGNAPGLARVVLVSWTSIPAVLRSVDSLGQLIERTAPGEPVAASNAVFSYVLMRVQAEEAVSAGGLRRDLAALRSVRDDVPFLWRNRSEYARARVDHHFTYGLDALLVGIGLEGR